MLGWDVKYHRLLRALIFEQNTGRGWDNLQSEIDIVTQYIQDRVDNGPLTRDGGPSTRNNVYRVRVRRPSRWLRSGTYK